MVRALTDLAPGHSPFLLGAGPLPPEPELAAELRQLVGQGRAVVLDRYVCAEVEKACFCACDAVLLLYVHHFGSSGVLAQAAAAGNPVIASDEGLIGYRVGRYGLGWLFRSGDVAALRQALAQVTTAPEEEWRTRREATAAYAAHFSRNEFRRQLLAAIQSA